MKTNLNELKLNKQNHHPDLYQAGLDANDISQYPIDQRELRFTRNKTALFLYVLSSILTISTILSVVYLLATINDFSDNGTILLVGTPCLLAIIVFLFYLGNYFAKHAYVIISPLGVEILPFCKPEKKLILINWHSIIDLNRCKNRIQISLNSGKLISISSACLRSSTYDLLFYALTERVTRLLQRYGKTGKTPSPSGPHDRSRYP